MRTIEIGLPVLGLVVMSAPVVRLAALAVLDMHQMSLFFDTLMHFLIYNKFYSIRFTNVSFEIVKFPIKVLPSAGLLQTTWYTLSCRRSLRRRGHSPRRRRTGSCEGLT